MERRWNIFARELEDILATQNLRLGHLDDRVAIHREKVRRLRNSLKTPKSFPVLNPEEMDEVILAFHLTNYDTLRLRAALLATSLEAMLMDRIEQGEALTAAEECFPILLKALLAHQYDRNGLGAIRGDDPFTSEDSNENIQVKTALAAVDRANIALHLAHTLSSPEQRQVHLQKASHDFEAALAELEVAPAEIKATEVWQECYNEASRGLSVTGN